MASLRFVTVNSKRFHTKRYKFTPMRNELRPATAPAPAPCKKRAPLSVKNDATTSIEENTRRNTFHIFWKRIDGTPLTVLRGWAVTSGPRMDILEISKTRRGLLIVVSGFDHRTAEVQPPTIKYLELRGLDLKPLTLLGCGSGADKCCRVTMTTAPRPESKV
ncbi:hypothetical protein EVAR_45090_1 [Eumeta japonica]|uniref:Uncharacterized protein n=1 Tax=Eumeta variegata TaxID=151549 RepID=A0A4C1YIX4_EUMVA|nr:hypothetical protein EVAR_45090_1 [Eumeta japonica]